MPPVDPPPPTSPTKPPDTPTTVSHSFDLGLLAFQILVGDSADLPRMSVGPVAFKLNPTPPIDFEVGAVLASYQPPGGAPRFDFMGVAPAAFSFSGLFEGDDAWDQFQATMRLIGRPQTVSYGRMSTTAWVETISLSYRRSDRIGFTLKLVPFATDSKVGTGSGVMTAPSPAQPQGGDPIPPPADQKPPTRRITTIDGDDLHHISLAQYGTDEYWDVIAFLNPQITDPSHVDAGEILEIPANAQAADEYKRQMTADKESTIPQDDEDPRGAGGN